MINISDFVGSIGAGKYILGPRAPVAITDAGLAVFKVAMPASAGWGGFLGFVVYATDGTEIQTRLQWVTMCAVNKAGVLTTNTMNLNLINAVATTGGSTLTALVTAALASNEATYTITPTGSLTETTYNVDFVVVSLRNQAVTLLV